MRLSVLVVPALLTLGACASTANIPPVVTWSYGAGNGDGVHWSGPAPKYSFAGGAGADVPVKNGAAPKVSYAYGAESTQGDMIQMAPPPPTQLAQPAPSQAPAQAPANPNTHS